MLMKSTFVTSLSPGWGRRDAGIVYGAFFRDKRNPFLSASASACRYRFDPCAVKNWKGRDKCDSARSHWVGYWRLRKCFEGFPSKRIIFYRGCTEAKSVGFAAAFLTSSWGALTLS